MPDASKVDELEFILMKAYPTPRQGVRSHALPSDQHICAHGSGEVIAWRYSPDGVTFHAQVTQFDSVLPEQVSRLHALQQECDQLWKQELFARPCYKPRLKFIPTDRGTEEAKLRRGTIILYPQWSGTAFISSFGANSDSSFSGFMPACSMEEARDHVHKLL